MGASESTPDDSTSSSSSSSSPSTSLSSSTPSGPPPDLDSFDVSGWLLLHIQPHSPASSLPSLTPYFDLLTHVNSTPLTSHESSLLSHILPHTPLTLTLFSTSTLTPRTLSLTPRPHPGDGLLGLLIRHDSLSSSTPLDCLRVLRVHEGSPAEEGGLRGGTDWLLGADRVAFKGWAVFDGWLEREEGKEVAVWVWSSNTWRVREVRLRLRKGWGGKGSLGADLAHGWKHRLPVWDEARRRPVRVERRSEVRVGKRGQRGLTVEDEQLFVQLQLPGSGEGGDEAVPLLCIRVREPGEEAAAPVPDSAAPSPVLTAKVAPVNHAHGDHGHSHAGEHGHSHGGDAHHHSHGQSHAHAAPPSSSTLPPGPAASLTTLTTSTTVPAALPSVSAKLASPAKKPLSAHLPRSRETSPQIQPSLASSAALSAAPAMPQLPQPAMSTGQRGPSSMGAPPFPSLAPNTAAFNPAVRTSTAVHDFT